MADQAGVAREIMEYLLLQLRDAKPNQPNVAPPQLHITNGALFALTRAGLIDESSATGWRDRIREERNRIHATLEDEAAHRAPLVVPPPQQVERATIREVLSEQLMRIEGEIFSAATQGRLIYPWNSRELPVARALVRALAELGVMSELEERTWNEKLRRAVDPEAQPVRTAHARARSAAAAEGRSAISVE